MGALRDRMHANMRLRDFSRTTIEAYLWHVTEFTRYFGKSPDLLGEEEVNSPGTLASLLLCWAKRK
jgi:hypothetical protein